MTDLTIVMPFYRNPLMLAKHYEWWSHWPDAIKNRLLVVLVDDGSPEPAAAVKRPKGLPELRIYRVGEDRPWHQHAARNLGAAESPDGWMLVTDMDHRLHRDDATELFELMDVGVLKSKYIYTLDRVEADTGLPTLGRHNCSKPHPNSFVLTKKLYWKIGGYDEDYCGLYGTDSLFRSRAFSRGRPGHLHVRLMRYWRDLIPDSSTRDLPRKEGRDPHARENIRRQKKERGEEDMIKVLQFPWERVL